MSGKGKIILRFKSLKTLTHLRIPDQQPSKLQKFVNWCYDNETGEAVIRVKDRTEIRLFDQMEVLSFSDDDLKISCENQLKCGSGAETKEEDSLFERVANRAWGIRQEVKELAEKVERREEHEAEV